MHHVSYHGEEVPVSEMLERLTHESHSVTTLTVSFAELLDGGCARFLQGLEKQKQWRRLRPGERSERIPGAGGVLVDPGIRALDLSSNQLTSFDKSGLTAAVEHNGTLSSLELQGNELCSNAPPAQCLDEIRRFARAVGTSSLRALNITANCLGDAGLAAFFDALPRTGTSLKTLCLSVNMFVDGESPEAQHGTAAARSIACFLSDPVACRGLERLHLNGNQFGWAGVRTIAHAIIGSRVACTLGQESTLPLSTLDALAPNRSVMHLDLFSTGIDSLSAPLSDEEPAFDWEASSLLTPSNWPVLLTHQLEANEEDRIATRKSAAKVLAAARIAGCKARDAGGEARGTFPLLRLPLELRGVVLDHLDEARALSRTQLLHVLAYACEPSTIGYGLRQVDYPVDQPHADEATLPILPWSWEECFATRSQPRNWYGEWIDLQREQPSAANETTPDLLAFWECTGTDHAA